MWRGTAVENGLAALLYGRSLEYAMHAASNSFAMNAGANNSDECLAESNLIEPMLETLKGWTAPGPLNATQQKIELYLDPVPVPVIGYLDLSFDATDVDLKTTKALPSKPRSDHVRQVSVYRKARNKPGGLLYCTTKKFEYFDISDDDMNEAIDELHADALALNNLLSRCDTKEDVLKSLPIDYSHYAAPKTKVALADLLLAG
jgi:hypothetical protein